MSTATQEPLVAERQSRGWFPRNWKWFVPSTFTVVAALVAITIFGYVQVRSYGYRQNPAYQAALAEVQSNKRVQELLGEPVVDSDWNPQGAIELRDNDTMGEARFNFTVSGPKGHADVITEGRMVDAEWALTRLELLTQGGERMRLTKEILAKQPVDTPKFDPAKAQRKEPATNEPSPESTEVNVQVPDLPPGLK
jgi:hypothetical protein